MAERIRINDVDFMVRRTVEQAPKHTFLREFVKNAEEAAALAPEGAREVRIYPVLVDGIRKLAIWNTGPGMSEAELASAMDLSSSLNKTMGLDGNFGIGAKVSGLAVSPHGIRYRSCKGGEVAELLIRWDEAHAGFVREWVVSETDPDHARDKDWTEVVLMGESAAHDTVSFPLGPDVKLTRSHIPTQIFRRFARFLPGVEVRVDTAMTKGGGKGSAGRTRQLKTLETVLEAPTLPEQGGFRHERVELNNDVVAHFIHDPKNPKTGHTLSSDKNPATGSTSFCALVHRGERYNFKTGRAWAAVAPAFGIGFGSTVLGVEIELPDDHALPTPYRDALMQPTDRAPLLAEHFAAQVSKAVPVWVQAIIREHSPAGLDDLSDVQAKLQAILDGFNGRKPRRGVRAPTKPRPVPVPEPAPTFFARLFERIGLTRKALPTPAPIPREPRLPPKPLGTAPELIMLSDPRAVADKGLAGRGARYYPEAGQLFVNGLYPTVDRLAHELGAELNASDPEAARRAALSASRHTLAFRVGKATCFAIAKQLRDDWSTDALDLATSPEALTLAADDIGQSRAEAKRLAKTLLKVEGVEA